MNTIEIRELTDAEMEQVSGGWKSVDRVLRNGGANVACHPDYAE